MNERRKHNRLPINLELEINRLFRQDNEILEHLDAEIEVVDISKNGIGFVSHQQFPLEYYFNAKIEFGEDQFFYCVIKIIREERSDDYYLYGCVFVGLAEFLAKKVDDYEDFLKKQE